MVDWIVNIVIPYTETVPLEIIVFLFSIIEELIPPIPAFPVLILSGGLASVQEYTFIAVFLLALCAAIGKTLGAFVVYLVVDKAEDRFVKRFGSYFAIAPGDLERFGNRFGNGLWDYVMLTSLRALPVVPSALITVASGLLHLPAPLYLISTLLGSMIRISFFLYAGYFSANTVITFLANTEKMSSILQYGSLAMIILVLTYLYFKNRRSLTP